MTDLTVANVELGIAQALKALVDDPRDDVSWRHLWRTLEPYALTVLRRATISDSSSARSNELVATAFAKIFLRIVSGEALELLGNPGGFRRYLALTVKRLAIDEGQSASRFATIDIVAELASSEFVARQVEDGIDVEILLDRVAARDRLLLQRLLTGDSIAQIAADQRVTPNAMRVRLHRLRRAAVALNSTFPQKKAK